MIVFQHPAKCFSPREQNFSSSPHKSSVTASETILEHSLLCTIMCILCMVQLPHGIIIAGRQSASIIQNHVGDDRWSDSRRGEREDSCSSFSSNWSGSVWLRLRLRPDPRVIMRWSKVKNVLSNTLSNTRSRSRSRQTGYGLVYFPNWTFQFEAEFVCYCPTSHNDNYVNLVQQLY